MKMSSEQFADEMIKDFPPRPKPVTKTQVEEVEENAAGCDAKRDNIRQGIQLFSDGGRYSQKPCREAIEEVKGGSDENHQDCPLVLSVEGCSCGDAT